MGSYIRKRLLETIFVVFGVSLLTFFMLNLTPGDTAETIARRVFVGFDEVVTQSEVDAVTQMFALDNSLIKQYFDWFIGIFRGDLGESYAYHVPVLEMLTLRLPNTMKLGASALLVAVIVGVPMGIVSAVCHNKLADYINRFISLFLVSFPSFWLGLLLIIVFSLKLKLLPVSGIDGWKTMVLPVATMAIGMIPNIAQMMRTSLLDVINQDFMVVAKAKGLKPYKIILKHALKNTLPSVITVIGIQAGHIFAGSVVIESVFAWPGVGKLLVDSINNKDMPMLQGCVLVMAISYTLINLIVDLLYAYIDSRVYFEGE